MTHLRPARHETSPETFSRKVVLVALHSSRFPLIGESHGVCAIAGYLRSSFPGIQNWTCDMQLMAYDDVYCLLERERPALLGVSVKLRTFDELIQLREATLKRLPAKRRPMLVLGNAIPNFNGHAILEQYFPDAIVGLGEGEIVMADMYRFANGQLPLEEVRNVLYLDEEGVHSTKRIHLDGADVSRPDRSNSMEFYRRGGEVYVEASRGCAYGGCTFCPTRDFLGSGFGSGMWRPRSVSSVLDDMETLDDLGIREVTFADEDFFGPRSEGLHRSRAFAAGIASRELRVRFRVNARVKSLCDRRDSPTAWAEREDAIQALHKAGLVKVYVGLESGVESQVKRYGKGFNLDEFSGARNLLARCGVECECGFIPLDPLTNISELSSALAFLKNEGLIHNVSSVYKEMRIHPDTPYAAAVRAAETATGIPILGDIDFGSYEYSMVRYLDKDVDFVARVVREWIRPVYRLYYLLRIFTQYSAQEAEHDRTRTVDRGMCFAAIRDIRSAEYEVLRDLVALIQERGQDAVAAADLMARFELRRRRIVENVASAINAGPTSREIEEMRGEVSEYLRESAIYADQRAANGRVDQVHPPRESSHACD